VNEGFPLTWDAALSIVCTFLYFIDTVTCLTMIIQSPDINKYYFNLERL